MGNWQPTQHTNLIRYVPSGRYFVRAKVAGRLVRQSLKTNSLEIALLKRDSLIADERARLAKDPVAGTTMANVIADYRKRLETTWTGKPRSLEEKCKTLDYLSIQWPGLGELEPSQAVDGIELGLRKLRAHYGPVYYNGCLAELRGVFEEAKRQGLIIEVPDLPRAPVGHKQKALLSRDEFARLLAFLDARPDRRHAAVAVRWMAYTGARVGTLPFHTRESIDLARNEVLIPAIKYDPHPVRVPIMGELRKLCERLLADRKDGPLFKSASVKKALLTACTSDKLKIPWTTAHSLRHLFATRCIESGVDIPTVSRWLGHKDGGALAMKTYGHLRNEHSQEQAKKVSFS